MLTSAHVSLFLLCYPVTGTKCLFLCVLQVGSTTVCVKQFGIVTGEGKISIQLNRQGTWTWVSWDYLHIRNPLYNTTGVGKVYITAVHTIQQAEIVTARYGYWISDG